VFPHHHDEQSQSAAQGSDCSMLLVEHTFLVDVLATVPRLLVITLGLRASILVLVFISVVLLRVILALLAR
jgi:hypothetical protein